MRALWVILGFIVGVIVSRNAVEMSEPQRDTVYGFIIIIGIIFYFTGKRDKASAVATAVATANANAEIKFNAEVESRANAIAQNAINIHFGDNPVKQADNKNVTPWYALPEIDYAKIIDTNPVAAIDTNDDDENEYDDELEDKYYA